MQWQTILLVLACAVSIGCSSNSEKLNKEIQDANSWIASARMVTDSFAGGAVPKPYTKDALQNFNRQLQSSGQRVQSISDSRATQAASVLQQAQQTISQIGLSIDRADNLSLAQYDLQLASQQNALAQLANSQQPQAQPR